MSRDDDERNQEAIKFYYESFKHLTTLNTAAGLVVITLHRDTSLSNLALVSILCIL